MNAIAPLLTERPLDLDVLARAEEEGFTPIQARILAGRLKGAEVADIRRRVHPTIADIEPPYSLPDIDVGADRIARAIIAREHIVLLTDYDTDGVSSHCVLKTAIGEMWGHPADRLHSLCGHRLRDGYGVSENVVRKLLDAALPGGVCLTADQGASDARRITTLREAGWDVVVTDHHGAGPDGIPRDAIAVINPTRADSSFPDPYICGACVAWLVACAVRQRLIDLGHLPADAPKLGRLLDFVATATMADAVSLSRSPTNRAVVAIGLDLMNRPDARPAWRAFRQLLGKAEPLTEIDLAWSVGPRINARGRLDESLMAVDFFLSKDEEQAIAMVETLDAHNLERREIEKKMRTQALEIAQPFVEAGRAGVVVYLGEGHSGIVGIVSARVSDATGRPSVCFAPKHGKSGVITGSLRTVPGFHVRRALSEIAELAPDVLIAHGGHEGAGGCTIREVDLARFVDLFEDAVRRQLDPSALAPRILTDGLLPVRATLDLIDETRRLAPFGREFDPPSFLIDATVLKVRPVGDGSHLKLVLRDLAGGTVDGIWFRAVEPGAPHPVVEGQRARFAFELDANTFRDKTTLQLNIRGIAPPPSAD